MTLVKRIASLAMFRTHRDQLVSKPVLCQVGDLQSWSSKHVFVCRTRDLVPTCSVKTKSLSLSLIIILTFLLYKIFHNQQCWCVFHSGCGPITVSWHEGGWENYINTLKYFRSQQWPLGLACGPLIPQVIQSRQPRPFALVSKLPQGYLDQGNLSKTRSGYTAHRPTYISLCILVTLRHHQRGQEIHHKWNIYNPY